MLLSCIFEFMNKLFNYSFIDARGKCAVEMQSLPEAAQAEIFCKIRLFQAPPAGVAEGRQVPLNLSPAFSADKVVNCGFVNPGVTGQAFFRE